MKSSESLKKAGEGIVFGFIGYLVGYVFGKLTDQKSLNNLKAKAETSQKYTDAVLAADEELLNENRELRNQILNS